MLPIFASAGLTLLTTLFVLVCLMLIIVILVQKPAGGGLVGAFGGAGGVQDFLGAKMGSKITWFTVILFSMFVVLSCILTVAVRPKYESTPAPAVASTTAPADTTSEKAPAPAAEKPAGPAPASTTAPTEKAP